jgi:hypothetical protein
LIYAIIQTKLELAVPFLKVVHPAGGPTVVTPAPPAMNVAKMKSSVVEPAGSLPVIGLTALPTFAVPAV